MSNRLYFGDNLDILRRYIADASVDLVYLDPPFNSNATYNVLFKGPAGQESEAQIEAFDDTWHWNDTAEKSFDEVMTSGNTDCAEMLRAMRSFLGENDMMAYLTMMAVRLIELHRVLKPTGSLYLHCDPTASHYLKILLDAVFGASNFRNEITWKRTSAHSDSKTWSKNTDIILFYSRSSKFDWNAPKVQHEASYIEAKYKNDDGDGRGPYQLHDMTSPSPRPRMMYEWLGFRHPPNGWRFERETMQKLHNENRIYYPRYSNGDLDLSKRPRVKRYLNEMEGSIVPALWTDVPPINSQAQERLGYPTQKPLALLERIIAASSKEGDVVLDPFCGCGTTVHAAQKLRRHWIGIDITHLAVGLIRRRLIDAFPTAMFDVLGVPKDLDGARALAAQDKHQFQLWALSMIEAQPYKGGRKGADGGVDGYVYFKPDGKATEKAVVSVKGGANVGVTMVRDLIATIEREGAKVGVFLTLEDPTTRMRTEASAAGLYKTEYLGDFPRIQILTIEDLFAGKKPHLPWIDPSVFRRARRETTETQSKLDL